MEKRGRDDEGSQHSSPRSASRADLRRPLEKLFRPRLEIEPCILMRFGPRDRRNSLHEIEDAFGLAPFLSQYGVDDLRGLRFRKAAFAQEFRAVIVAARDDTLPRRLDAVYEGQG